jgi:hypothetical protein
MSTGSSRPAATSVSRFHQHKAPRRALFACRICRSRHVRDAPFISRRPLSISTGSLTARAVIGASRALAARRRVQVLRYLSGAKHWAVVRASRSVSCVPTSPAQRQNTQNVGKLGHVLLARTPADQMRVNPECVPWSRARFWRSGAVRRATAPSRVSQTPLWQNHATARIAA